MSGGKQPCNQKSGQKKSYPAVLSHHAQHRQFRGRYEITITFCDISLRPLIPLKGVLKRVPFTILKCSSYF
jgi:hypothetical protein